MSTITYKFGNWSNPKLVPKPRMPLKAYVPPFPTLTGDPAENTQILTDYLQILKNEGFLVSSGDAASYLSDNGYLSIDNSNAIAAIDALLDGKMIEISGVKDENGVITTPITKDNIIAFLTAGGGITQSSLSADAIISKLKALGLISASAASADGVIKGLIAAGLISNPSGVPLDIFNELKTKGIITSSATDDDIKAALGTGNKTLSQVIDGIKNAGLASFNSMAADAVITNLSGLVSVNSFKPSEFITALQNNPVAGVSFSNTLDAESIINGFIKAGLISISASPGDFIDHLSDPAVGFIAFGINLNKIASYTISNSGISREYRRERGAYREAKLNARENQAAETREMAKSLSRQKADQKKNLMTALQRSMQENKAIERKMISQLANKWRTNNAENNKQKKK